MADESDSDNSSEGRDHRLSGKKSRKEVTANAARKGDGQGEASKRVEKGGSKDPSTDSSPNADGEYIPRSVRESGSSDGSGDSGSGDAE